MFAPKPSIRAKALVFQAPMCVMRMVMRRPVAGHSLRQATPARFGR